jgi:hypothetical protein
MTFSSMASHPGGERDAAAQDASPGCTGQPRVSVPRECAAQAVRATYGCNDPNLPRRGTPVPKVLVMCTGVAYGSLDPSLTQPSLAEIS